MTTPTATPRVNPYAAGAPQPPRAQYPEGHAYHQRPVQLDPIPPDYLCFGAVDRRRKAEQLAILEQVRQQNLLNQQRAAARAAAAAALTRANTAAATNNTDNEEEGEGETMPPSQQ